MTDHIINLIESFLIIIFLHASCLERPTKKTVILSAVFTVLSFLHISWVNTFSVYEDIGMKIVDIAILAVYMKLISDASWSRVLMITTIPLVLIASINICTASFFSWLFYGGLDYPRLAGEHYGLMIFLTKVLFLAVSQVTAILLRKKTDWLSSSDCITILVLLILFSMIITFFENLVFYQDFSADWIILVLTCINGSAILVVYLIHKLNATVRSGLRTQHNLEVLQAQLDSFQSFEAKQAQLNKWAHDMKHFYNALLNTEHNEIAEKMKTMYEEMQLPIILSKEPYGLVLNAKYREAKQAGIDYNCSIRADIRINMDRYDLCLLLSNLLDNAIYHIGSGKKILVEIDDIQDYSRIRITNSIDGPVLDENGDFIFCGDHHGHGYGVNTILTLTSNYSGRCLFEESDGNLISTVIIPSGGTV